MAEVKKATVFNPTTQVRKEIEVGDPTAFEGGFVLEESFDPNTGISTQAQKQTKITEPVGEIKPTGAVTGGKAEEAVLPEPTPIEEPTKKKTETTDKDIIDKEVEDEQTLQDISKETQLLLQSQVTALDNFSKTLDERSKAIIENIKATFENRRNAQEQLNKAVLGGIRTRGFTSGRTRFAPDLQSQVISTEESAGISRLATLDTQEQQLILEAQSAADDKQFAILNAKTEALLKVQQEKKDIIIELNKQAVEEEKLLLERVKQAREDAKFELEIAKFDRESEKILADLTGVFRGSPTFEADQAAMKNLVDIAGLTGEFNGEPTVEGKKLILDEAFNIAKLTGVFEGEPTLEAQDFGLDISKFEEMIRSNKAQEALKVRANAISAGNLALSQAKFAAEQAEDIIAQSGDVKAAIDNLPVGQQENAFAAVASFKNAADIIALLDKGVETGPISGRQLTGISLDLPFTESDLPITPGTQALGKSTPEENQLLAAMTAFSANFIKSISGVAVADAEFKRLMNALPGINRQEEVNRDSLKSLLNAIQNKYETQLGIDLEQLKPENLRKEIPEGEEDDLDEFLNSF